MPPDQSAMSPETVSDRVADKFGLSVPVHTMRTLLERAKRKYKLLVQRDSTYLLTPKGLRYVASLETERAVERRISSFIAAASQYLAERHEIFAAPASHCHAVP